MAFRHGAARDLAAPGFYLHLEPGNVFAGAGLWHAPSEALRQVRDAIVAHPARWKRVLSRVDHGEREDGLKRAPRGYDPEHPFVEDLKRTSFTAGASFSEKEACAPDFAGRFTAACRQTAPLMEFLSSAVGVPW
jgi:uncharacterized protein (TIGR02453 family)